MTPAMRIYRLNLLRGILLAQGNKTAAEKLAAEIRELEKCID